MFNKDSFMENGVSVKQARVVPPAFELTHLFHLFRCFNTGVCKRICRSNGVHLTRWHPCGSKPSMSANVAARHAEDGGGAGRETWRQRSEVSTVRHRIDGTRTRIDVDANATQQIGGTAETLRRGRCSRQASAVYALFRRFCTAVPAAAVLGKNVVAQHGTARSYGSSSARSGRFCR